MTMYQMDNCWNFSIDHQNKLASAIRIHLITKETPRGPSFDVFPDVIGPMIENGYRVV